MAIAGRSYAAVPVIVRGSLEDPADFGSRTAIVVVTSQPAAAQTAVPRVTVVRSTLQDPPVLTTAAPVVVAAAPDRRWLGPSPVMVLAAPQAAPAVLTATPGPLVIAVQAPWPKTVQALTVRSTLADPPVLTTPGPVVAAAQPDRRWLAGRPPLVLAGGPAYVPPPAGRGLLMAGYI